MRADEYLESQDVQVSPEEKTWWKKTRRIWSLLCIACVQHMPRISIPRSGMSAHASTSPQSPMCTLSSTSCATVTLVDLSCLLPSRAKALWEWDFVGHCVHANQSANRGKALAVGTASTCCMAGFAYQSSFLTWYLDMAAGGSGIREPLLSEEALQNLWDTPELDYLTHVVFRMYENKRYDTLTALPVIQSHLTL